MRTAPGATSTQWSAKVAKWCATPAPTAPPLLLNCTDLGTEAVQPILGHAVNLVVATVEVGRRCLVAAALVRVPGVLAT